MLLFPLRVEGRASAECLGGKDAEEGINWGSVRRVGRGIMLQTTYKKRGQVRPEELVNATVNRAQLTRART